ncbi:nicotinate-nucleotide--dimethylbenzimidazole phosphoribosyltransferase [Herbaspirillum sp. RV1423]|uniref:nicotinate-nucleotide--dimethylbenzimidazole phosphoribosyltransferase n=1 Tax=Herbaspirillum sp. RV1423 TaxID=1443993 RepID=UPI0004BA7FDD|nr:nicotinate-nucleotide--dimethylbenzimidazole phosphoribosyltransferase [Herbaspirillum sp. RV1423]
MRLPQLSSTQDEALASALQAMIDNKTKPQGSLGVLEFVAHRIGLIQKSRAPRIDRAAVVVFAADHGIVAENISAYPQSVTWQMVENFLQQGAAINVFARQNDCALHIVDAGVNHDFGGRAGLIDRKLGPGTRNFAEEPAMSVAQCEQALQYGMDLVEATHIDVIGFGEMGIGNTTAAAAIMHKITGIAVGECVGAGTGLAAEGIRHKQRVIEQAVQRHAGVDTPLDILRTFGGFEIAMIAGAMLKAAERRMVLLIDGFIVTSALLAAAKLQPAILDYCLFSHCSDEHGHRRMLQYLDARPLMQLDLRLGEGTGSALALPLLHAAVNFLAQMATFSSAQVSEKSA